MKLRIALLAATVLAAPLVLPQVARAQPVTGLYVGAGGGYNVEERLKATDFIDGGAEVPGYSKTSVRGGYTGEASIGYGFGNGLRVELEGDYYNNRFFNTAIYLNGQPSIGSKAYGYEQKYGAFLNALYDFDVGLPFLYPYVGGGVGYQILAYNPIASDYGYADKNKDALAFQGIAGLSFPIPPVVGLSATVEYRFMEVTGSRKLNGQDFDVGNAISFKLGHEYNNSVLVGLRYAFGVEPPPPPPEPVPVAAPAPAPAKTYLVFFDWDKYNLTPRALDIIAQAASDSKTQQTTTIAVNGYTDTSGTAAYNQGLSVRRANAVEAQLVTDGVPASEITAQGFGDTDLLVPTGPGVREPQNRRVQIVLQ
jgi:outer membrane protein OmpA-like peptidoglycan-associated protein